MTEALASILKSNEEPQVTHSLQGALEQWCLYDLIASSAQLLQQNDTMFVWASSLRRRPLCGV